MGESKHLRNNLKNNIIKYSPNNYHKAMLIL